MAIVMARELTPRAYKRLLQAFTPEEAKTTMKKWVEDNPKKYSSTNQKVYIDGGVFKYTKGGDVTKKLRLAIFKKLNTIIGKELSKRHKKHGRTERLCLMMV